MKASKLLGIVVLVAFTFCVSQKTYASQTKDPPKYNVSEVDFSVEKLIPVFNYEMEKPQSFFFDALSISAYSYAPVGKPNTKFKAQSYFYPLKLC